MNRYTFEQNRHNYIYYERQKGSLCARHCLNNIVQGSFFNTKNLEDISSHCQDQEAQLIHGTNLKRYPEISNKNINAVNGKDGNYSIQVIDKALGIHGLTIQRIELRDLYGGNVKACTCFLINGRQHWFCLRQIHGEWFYFNSTKGYPYRMSTQEHVLTFLFTVMEQKQYNVWCVIGDFQEIK
eukprot:UN24691